MKIPKTIRYILITLIPLVVLFALVPVRICTDRAYICEYTASSHGDREWFFGAHTHRWEKPSELERFIQQNHPNELKHKWTRYAGTGRNIFGMRISHGHGRPGPILFLRNHIDSYCQKATPNQKKAFYDTMIHGDEKQIRNAVDQAYERLWSDSAETSNPVTNTP